MTTPNTKAIKLPRTGSKLDQVGREMLACIYEALLSDGHIDPKGKTEEQLMAEVCKSALKWSNQRPMLMSTDFRRTILAQARNLRRKKRYSESILYYATWFEHWINGILLRKLCALNMRESCQMIRDVNLRGKFTWLMVLIHDRRIAQKHVNVVLHVSDLRNEFVHYKFKLAEVDDHSDEQKYGQVFKRAEETIRYLKRFEMHHFFKGAARDLLKKIRKNKDQRGVSVLFGRALSTPQKLGDHTSKTAK